MIIQITTTHEALAALLTTETYYQLAPSQTHSEFALFGKELDCASVVTATHAPSSHRFLSTWGAVMLERKKQTITIFTVALVKSLHHQFICSRFLDSDWFS